MMMMVRVGDGCHEEIKDENVILSKFCHMCEVILGNFFSGKVVCSLQVCFVLFFS